MKNIRTFTSFMLFILLQQNLFDIYIKFTIDVRTDVLLHGRRPEVAFSSYQWPHQRWSVRSQTIPQPDAVSVHRRRVLASDILYPEDGPKFYSRLDLGQGYKVARGRARWILVWPGADIQRWHVHDEPARYRVEKQTGRRLAGEFKAASFASAERLCNTYHQS